MTARRYVIVGGGMAADAAAQAIRETDAAGDITLLCAESDPPYARPPLSKALWKGDPLESIWRGTEKTGAHLVLNRRVMTIDRKAKRVTDDRGQSYSYDALLLATGAAPIQLKLGGDRVIYFRTVDSYRKLRALADHVRRFAVIGNGFIGSEIAAALRMAGREVVLLFPETGIGARVFPQDMSEYLVGFYREKGVDVRPGEIVHDVIADGSYAVVNTAMGNRYVVDAVVAGIGVQPNVELAQQAGLTVDNGVVVNDRLQTSDPDIFAAGDVARFPVASLARSMRFEHEDAALSMGRFAGEAMAGKTGRYTHLPMFYSDLFDLGYEAVGIVDRHLSTNARWKTPFREGVVVYSDENKIRGALLVNTWGKVDKARQAIVEGLSPEKAHDLIAAE